MSGPVYDSDGEPRYFGIYFGFVTENVDPQLMGRVRVMIPGLIGPSSGWARPLAFGGGSPQNGGWDIPKKNAAIAIMFHHGDIDEPVYFHGWYGLNCAPQPAIDAGAEDAANKIKCFESDRHLVVLDGRTGSENVLIKDKVSGMTIAMHKEVIFLGDEQLVPIQDGVLTGKSKDPFTGMDHWMLGNSSNVVRAKK